MTRKEIRILIADDDPEDLELIEEHILRVEPEALLFQFRDGSLPISIYLHYRMKSFHPCSSWITICPD
jgi:hypothetical protein